MPREELLVSAESGAGLRLDVFLASRVAGLTRSQAGKAADEGRVLVNDVPKKPAAILRPGDRVVLVRPEAQPAGLEAQDIPLQILYRDEDLIVVDKPFGLVVHPGAGVRSGTLANALLHAFPEVLWVGEGDRPGIVHRLDMETSGVMVVARSPRAYESLKEQFKDRRVKKVYRALVWGRMRRLEGLIDAPIGRHPRHGQRMSVKTRRPRAAETRYTVLEEFPRTTLLEVRPLTGRTHQIRVHLAAAGHPLVGDTRYGRKKGGRRYPRLFLHACRLAFAHPATGQPVEFSSPLPPELEAVLRAEREP